MFKDIKALDTGHMHIEFQLLQTFDHELLISTSGLTFLLVLVLF